MPALSLSWLGILLFVGVVLNSTGCAVQPTTDATLGIAHAAGLQTSYVKAGDFELLVVRASAAPVPAERRTAEETYAAAAPRWLNVYIAGDGTPWRGAQVARNPGPFQPLAIRLMQRDPGPAVFLGRPCYHSNPLSQNATGCRPSLWSFERFSARVVEAMAIALRQLAADAPETRLSLIGYSGGGVLATLLAHEVVSVERLITVAAPLDVAAWGMHHRYTPLLGSLNPAELPALRNSVVQLHLQGANDNEVPPAVTLRYFSAQNPVSGFDDKSTPARLRRVLEGHTHRCCWLKQWPQLLREQVMSEYSGGSSR